MKYSEFKSGHLMRLLYVQRKGFIKLSFFCLRSVQLYIYVLCAFAQQ